MVGGFRHVRHYGYDPEALRLAEARRRKGRVAESHRRMVEGIVQCAQDALARGDIYEFATLNYRVLAEVNPNPALRTREAYDMTIRYFAGLPLNQTPNLPQQTSQPNLFDKLINYVRNIFRRNKTQLNKPEETA